MGYIPVQRIPRPLGSLGALGTSFAPLGPSARLGTQETRFDWGARGKLQPGAAFRLPSQKSPLLAWRAETETASDRACGLLEDFAALDVGVRRLFGGLAPSLP